MTRLDVALVARGLIKTRSRARAAIEAGTVTVNGVPAHSPSQKVDDAAVLAATDAHPWVGRGALKLDHALSLWPVAVEGRTVLDVGASTGGFTEVCLSRGAARVFAVDVGSGQLHARVAANPRVVNLERTDARELTPALISEPPQLIVCDASFIGLAKVLPVALSLAAADADLVTLVKPQFEATGPGGTKKGVVRDPAAQQAALAAVCDWLEGEGWAVQATTESPITGGDGNVEFLLWGKRSGQWPVAGDWSRRKWKSGPGPAVARWSATHTSPATGHSPPDKEKPPVDCSTGGLRHAADRQGG